MKSSEGDKLAESKTLSDREYAIDEYRANGGTLFHKWSTETETEGERLAHRLDDAVESLKLDVAKAELLQRDDQENLLAALQLPLEIHYAQFTYVGSGGNCHEDGRFDIEECWDECEETEIRAKVIEALYGFCLFGAVTARRLGAKATQRLFMYALYHIETNCRTHEYSNVPGGCSKPLAENICKSVVRAACQLWAELEVDNKALAIADPAKKPKKEEGALETITLGAWAAEIVEPLAPGSQTLVFKGNRKVTLTVPKSRKAAWMCIKAVLTSRHPQGWAELPDSVGNWTAHFRVVGATDVENHDIVDPNDDLTQLRYRLENQNAPGKRGRPTLRLRAEFNCKEYQKVRVAYEEARKSAREAQKSSLK